MQPPDDFGGLIGGFAADGDLERVLVPIGWFNWTRQCRFVLCDGWRLVEAAPTTGHTHVGSSVHARNSWPGREAARRGRIDAPNGVFIPPSHHVAVIDAYR